MFREGAEQGRNEEGVGAEGGHELGAGGSEAEQAEAAVGFGAGGGEQVAAAEGADDFRQVRGSQVGAVAHGRGRQLLAGHGAECHSFGEIEAEGGGELEFDLRDGAGYLGSGCKSGDGLHQMKRLILDWSARSM